VETGHRGNDVSASALASGQRVEVKGQPRQLFHFRRASSAHWLPINTIQQFALPAGLRLVSRQLPLLLALRFLRPSMINTLLSPALALEQKLFSVMWFLHRRRLEADVAAAAVM
jgi:hypothetical protein